MTVLIHKKVKINKERKNKEISDYGLVGFILWMQITLTIKPMKAIVSIN